MISLLLTARENSKYLAKFIATFLVNTKDFNNVELLIFLPATDTWNKEIIELAGDRIKVVPDHTELGRGASHIFYEEVAKEAKGDWLWYLCDDHYLFKDYDEYITNYINEHHLDPNKINVVVPAVENSGRISHIFSRKYYETIGFGKHGNVDSYHNDTLEYLELFVGEPFKQVLHLPPKSVMLDFSLVKDLMKTKNRADFNELAQIKLFKSDMMRQKIRDDAERLRRAL